MSIFPQAVPLYISLLFLVVIPTPLFMLAGLARKGAQVSATYSGAKVYGIVLGFYGLYFSYVVWAAMKGWFVVLSLPPRIIVLAALPLLAFYLLLGSLKPVSQLLASISTSDLISIHIFRLIGSFFLILMVYEALPLTMGLVAGLGDMITAISSIWVARMVKRKSSNWKAIAYGWNTFGLLDILLTSAMAFYFTKLSIETGLETVEILGAFPFCFIPAFAPATIIFLHISIYRKLLRAT